MCLSSLPLTQVSVPTDADDAKSPQVGQDNADNFASPSRSAFSPSAGRRARHASDRAPPQRAPRAGLFGDFDGLDADLCGGGDDLRIGRAIV